MATTTVMQEAAKIVSLKKKVNDLLEQIDFMKKKIQPYVMVTPVKTLGGTVSLVKGSQSLYLSKTKMRQVLEQTLKLSPTLVDKILLLGAEKKIIGDYVKITLEK